MKAIRIHEYGDSGTLKLEDVPRLSPGKDQLWVHVRDAGVNPIDRKIRQGYLKDVMPASFPLTIGQDFAGEVSELGDSVKDFEVGDRETAAGWPIWGQFIAHDITADRSILRPTPF